MIWKWKNRAYLTFLDETTSEYYYLEYFGDRRNAFEMESGNDVIDTFSVAQTLMRNGIRGNGKEPEVRDPRGEGSLRIFMENG